MEFVEMAASSSSSEPFLFFPPLLSPLLLLLLVLLLQWRGFIYAAGCSLFGYALVTGVCLAVTKLTALLGYIHALVNLLTRDT